MCQCRNNKCILPQTPRLEEPHHTPIFRPSAALPAPEIQMLSGLGCTCEAHSRGFTNGLEGERLEDFTSPARVSSYRCSSPVQV